MPDSARENEKPVVVGIARFTEGEHRYVTLALLPTGEVSASETENGGSGTWLAPFPKSARPDELVGTWDHFKGGVYRFVGRAIDARTGEYLVVYLDRDETVWVRPEHMIQDIITRKGYSGPRFIRRRTGR
jgi:hypothetical protein